MKRLIVHIGMHRTGSTAIQNFLKEGRGFAEADCCVFMPKCCRGSANSSEYFMAGMSDYQELREFLEGDNSIFIISAEELSKLRNENIYRLKDLFESAGMITEVVAFYRQPDAYIDSAASQLIDSAGYTLIGLFGCDGLIPRYDLLVEWSRAFEKRIKLNAYGGDSVLIFSELLGINHRPVSTPHVNPSKCVEYLTIKSALNESIMQRNHAAAVIFDVLTKINSGNQFVLPKEIVQSVLGQMHNNIRVFNDYFGERLDYPSVHKRLSLNQFYASGHVSSVINHLLGCFIASMPKVLKAGLNAAKDAGEYGHSSMFQEFDALGYFLANLDLCFVDVSPFSHYLQHGRAEGRTFIKSS